MLTLYLQKIHNMLVISAEKAALNLSACIITAVFTIVMPFSFVACSDKHESVKMEGERHELPSLKEYDISTVVSDSGITRYRLISPELLVYDKAPEPYSLFPNGVHLERFDENYDVDANLYADRAKYFEQKNLWQLNGNVKITNLAGEVFETEELFWDQRSEQVYTEKFITITQTDRTITGNGFESNQSFSQYVIKRPKGIFRNR